MKSLQGHLLVAPAQERDLNFLGTVILLIQHSEEQAVGVVLNRPTTTTIRQVWRGKGRCQRDECVYLGGPVAGPLMALHTDETLGKIEVLPGVYYSVQDAHLERLVRYPKHPFKMFSSHVGWAAGELERFVAEGDWGVVPATAGHVFHPGPRLWEEIQAGSGRQTKKGGLA